MKACFMGLGYVGLPTAVIAARNGVEVLGVDINPEVVEKTNRGELHILEPALGEMFLEVIGSRKLRASTTPEEADAYFIVVPTPFKGDHEPDISYIETATKMLLPLLKKGDLYVIESTSPVGTTDKMRELIYNERPDLEGTLDIAYCPERVLPGNVVYELVHNDRVIGGETDRATDAAVAFYSKFVKGALHRTDSRTAELCKLTENSSRDVQIAFANTLSLICDKAGVNVWELIELANRHPRVNILQPGSGVGGHCIAIDPYFITADFPQESRLITEARRTNNYKALWCAEKILHAITRFRQTEGRNPVVALMGLAFKPNIDDLRESPAVEIAKEVSTQNIGAELLIVEPYIAEYQNFKLTDYHEAYKAADIVATLTAHSQFKELVYDEHKTILDFAGVWKQ